MSSPTVDRSAGVPAPRQTERVIDLLRGYETEHEQSLRRLAADREHMTAVLEQVPGLRVLRSRADFVLVRLPAGWSGTGLRDHLVAHHGVFTHERGDELGLTTELVRLVVRPAADVERLLGGLHAHAQLRRHRTRRSA